MKPRAAAKGRRPFLLAAVCLLFLVVATPTAEASRSLPATLAPTLDAPPTPDHVLDAELSDPPERLRLFDDLRLPERPLELVEASKTASGVFTLGFQSNIWQAGGLGQNRGGPSFQGLWTDPVTGIAYARNRWYDARTASWLSEDPKGAVDSPNLYAFVGWGPHAGTDPMGLHEFRRAEIGGRVYSIGAPSTEELEGGDFSLHLSWEWRGKTRDLHVEGPGALAWVQLAKEVGGTYRESWEAFYGHSIDEVPFSALDLHLRGMWEIKEELVLSILGEMIAFGPAGGMGDDAARVGSKPKINLSNPRPSKPPPKVGANRPPTKGTYRKDFRRVSETPDDHQAHHSLFQKYEREFSDLGVNVHEERFLRGADPKIHAKITAEITRLERSLGRRLTTDEVFDLV